jgi:hypothetical protein
MFDAALLATGAGLASLAAHLWTHKLQTRSRRGAPERAVPDGLRRLSTISYSVWGRVVPDIPDFCRELVAALAEQ